MLDKYTRKQLKVEARRERLLKVTEDTVKDQVGAYLYEIHSLIPHDNQITSGNIYKRKDRENTHAVDYSIHIGGDVRVRNTLYMIYS